MQIIEREVEFAPGAKPELYHAVGQQDYTAIVARTPNGRISIVRQYRPALERFTWELPAGLVEKGEAPEVCCRRELLEETGFTARSVHMLGSYAACTARLSNRIHSFFVETGPRSDRPATEPGMELKLVAPKELAGTSGRRIRAGIAYWRPATRKHAGSSRSRHAVTRCALRRAFRQFAAGSPEGGKDAEATSIKN